MFSYTYLLADSSAAVPDSSSGLMRLLDTFGVRTDLLVAQIVNFCLVAYVLYRFAIKPILKTVEARQNKIAEGLKYAEEMKEQLAVAEQEHLETIKKAQAEAQSILDRTKKDGETYLEEQRNIATQKIEHMFDSANNSIETERKQMLAEARVEVATLVVSTTERILKKTLTKEMQKTLNEEAIKAVKDEVV